MIKIRHTGIVTKNLKHSLDFWVKALGFKVKKTLNESGELIDKIIGYRNVRVKTLKLIDSYGHLIEILYFFNSPKSKKISIKPYTNGYTHISLTETLRKRRLAGSIVVSKSCFGFISPRPL